MEIRQIIMVAVFMFAAALMKNAVPSQVPTEVVSISGSVDDVQLDPEPMITALAPAADLLPALTNSSVLSANSDAASLGNDFETAPIPGSFIALVVAAMALVSVARRPL